MSENENLLIHIEQGVATLTLNRLKQHNAFDSDLIRAIQNALDQIANNSQVRVLKFAANGKFFCAGGDLNWFKNATQLNESDNLADAAQLAQLLRTLNEFPKPTLALVQGPAYGGGVGLIACCDIAIAAESATFSLSEVKLGLVPATIAPYVLRAIGARQLRRYALTAEGFSAHEAHRIGLIHTVVSDEDLSDIADNTAAHLLNNGPVAIATTKQLIRELLLNSSDEFEKTAALLAKIRVSEEAQEGIKAFLEKIEPRWKLL
jgi:methylglutaconyl-CoA hydratase